MSCVIRGTSTCITPSTVLPITVEYAKTHLKAISDREDALVEAWILAAAQDFEGYTGRVIMRSVWEYWLDAVPVEVAIQLPNPPLVSVDSVSYLDTSGTLQSWTDGGSPETVYWGTRAPQGVYAPRGWITPIVGQLWPTVGSYPGVLRIRYTAGYAETADDVPDVIKATLLMLVGAFDQFRSQVHISEGAKVEEVPFVANLLTQFRHTALSTQVLHRVWP